MRAPSLILLLVLALVVVFAGANWSAISANTPVSLLVTTVQAPLGLIMIGITIVVTVMFLAFLVYLQTSILLDSRRHSRELQAQRELADKAEASRFTELRSYLDVELRRLSERSAELRADVASRIDGARQDLRTTIEQSENGLAAMIGELDDRLHPDTAGAGPAR